MVEDRASPGAVGKVGIASVAERQMDVTSASRAEALSYEM